ncbi:glutaminase A [Streptomyces sp. NBC_00572]|uniref:glutaminase A n=1 Tax=Streptomyces sp. NBC_00572 TaxID=2903664 RepID=UPI0022504084|nr:glutaminase A [Streptomyces sp. NBC_00572]MCX4984431.1 glutaminase A [Streptomyces sp. NBC_00572]
MVKRVVFDAVNAVLADLCREFRELNSGHVATYIPPLARAEPGDFGMALTSAEGHRYQAGEADKTFTIQSVSKPFVLALALTELGADEVFRRVGAEPSGERFNAISLDPETGRPANPMINAGAIATTALVPAASAEQRFTRILETLGSFAGRSLDVDDEVYRAEAATGDRNIALAHLMRAAGSLAGDPSGVLDVYFRQCAIRVTALDLSVMAATLANGGVNPVTGARVVPEPVTVQVLAVMATCGMYDGSGDWLLRVGLPAKSGVSGGLVAVRPGRSGVGCYSPLLDAAGNPVRAVAALAELSREFGLHLMHNPPSGAPTIIRPGPGDGPDEAAWRQAGGGTATGDLPAWVAAQGELDFTAAEQLVCALAERLPEVGRGRAVIDLVRVTAVDTAAEGVIRVVLERVTAMGHLIGFVGDAAVPFSARGTMLASRSAAVEWARLPS